MGKTSSKLAEYVATIEEAKPRREIGCPVGTSGNAPDYEEAFHVERFSYARMVHFSKYIGDNFGETAFYRHFKAQTCSCYGRTDESA